MSLPSNELLPAAEPATSPFASATANIQAAARWIVAALAAVGGVLVSSVPLTGLGKFNSLGEFFEAGLGLLVALAAVGFMIRSAARVLTTPYITVAALRDAEIPPTAGSKPRPITATLKQVKRNSDELFGEVAEDLGDLNTRLGNANEALRNESAKIVPAAAPPAPAPPAPGVPGPLQPGGVGPEKQPVRNESAAIVPAAAPPAPAVPGPPQPGGVPPEDQPRTTETLTSVAARLQAAARTVVDFANYDVARRNFSTLTVRLLAAGFISVLGVADYAYFVSRPEIQIGQPTPVLVSLPPTSDQAKSLGANCNTSRVFAVAISGTIQRPTVVTVPTDQCAALRFKVPSAAVVIPVKDLPSP
jgi:hypothetical protein